MNRNKEKVKNYSYGFIFPFLLKKYWFWFSHPFNVSKAAMVNFFSYEKYDTKGFRRSDGLTTVIDLNQDLETIWLNTRKKFVRKQIKKGERNGILVKHDPNFGEFKKIYKIFRKNSKLPKDNIRAYKNNAILLAAYYQGSMIAGGIFISNGIYYRALVLASLHKTSDGRGREIIGQANRMVIWEAIKNAKQSKHSLFDLGGISPDSKNKQLVSLAEFKEAFGGKRKSCYYYFKIYSPLIKIWMKLRGFKNV